MTEYLHSSAAITAHFTELERPNQFQPTTLPLESDTGAVVLSRLTFRRTYMRQKAVAKTAKRVEDEASNR